MKLHFFGMTLIYNLKLYFIVLIYIPISLSMFHHYLLSYLVFCYIPEISLSLIHSTYELSITGLNMKVQFTSLVAMSQSHTYMPDFNYNCFFYLVWSFWLIAYYLLLQKFRFPLLIPYQYYELEHSQIP